VDGLNTVNFPAPDYIDVEGGDCVGWAWLDYGAISFDFADINIRDRSQNLAYCWGENTGATSGRAKFDGTVALDVVPDPDSPLVRSSHAYKFRPSYRKYALQAEFCSCVARADIVFVLDGSGSVNFANSTNFQTMLEFVNNFIDYFEIGADAVRIGVLKFSSNVTNEIFLNDHYDKGELAEAVSKIDYIDGSTHTNDSIHEMRTVQFTTGHGDRYDAEDIAIVITDGVYSPGYDPQTEVDAAQAAKISMYSVGIGYITKEYVKSLSSHPQTEGENYWTTTDFDTLEALHSKIASKICVY
jgi:hypothetical protein